MKNTARNDVTGDFIRSKPSSDMFEEGWDRIFDKKKETVKLTQHEACSIETIEALIEIQKEKELKRELNKSIKEHEETYKALAEYELNKSTGEVQKVDDGTTTNT